MSRNRSRSSTCVVARSMPFSFRGVSLGWWTRGSAGESRCSDQALLRIDRAEALDDLEPAASGLRDVHLEAQMVLPGDHRRRPTRPLGDLCPIERRDHISLVERPNLAHGGGPEPQPAIEAGARAATRELRLARVERVVLREELLAKPILDGL